MVVVNGVAIGKISHVFNSLIFVLMGFHSEKGYYSSHQKQGKFFFFGPYLRIGNCLVDKFISE